MRKRFKFQHEMRDYVVFIQLNFEDIYMCNLCQTKI